MNVKMLSALCAVAIVASPSLKAFAQPTGMPAMSRVSAPAEPNAIPLYGAETPGSTSTEIWSNLPGQASLAVRNVTRPTLTPYLPRKGRNTGAAVIVAPGGAFVGLAYELEGTKVARALADRGIAAFVLKYRLIPTPASDAEMGPFVAQLMARGLSNPDRVFDMQHAPATDDALAAIAMVRREAGRWQVNPQRVGIIGFSAGAMTALSTVMQGSADQRPSFVGYVYGPQVRIPVPTQAPPLFAAFALDDPLFRSRGFPLIEAWQEAKRPVELHAYQKGGHGFGFGMEGTTTTLIGEEFAGWLAMQGFLQPAASRK